MSRSYFSVSWMKDVRNEHNLKPCFATNDPIITLGKIELYLKLDVVRVKTIFTVVETFPVNVIIVTEFMDKYVLVIHLQKDSSSPSSKLIAIFSTVASDKFVIATASA